MHLVELGDAGKGPLEGLVGGRLARGVHQTSNSTPMWSADLPKRTRFAGSAALKLASNAATDSSAAANSGRQAGKRIMQAQLCRWPRNRYIAAYVQSTTPTAIIMPDSPKPDRWNSLLETLGVPAPPKHLHSPCRPKLPRRARLLRRPPSEASPPPSRDRLPGRRATGRRSPAAWVWKCPRAGRPAAASSCSKKAGPTAAATVASSCCSAAACRATSAGRHVRREGSRSGCVRSGRASRAA